MSEISEIEIKSMTKEQNYMRGYEDGKSDVLDKIRTEITELWKNEPCPIEYGCLNEILQIINKYISESEDSK